VSLHDCVANAGHRHWSPNAVLVLNNVLISNNVYYRTPF